MFTVDEIRSHFPALWRTHNGHPVAYFDGPGGTQVPTAVVDAMSDYLLNHNANTHWSYPTSSETDSLIAAAREAFADFLNCGTDEVAFGQNMTTLTFHLSRALGRDFGEGDEIICTELDHHANIDTWRYLEKERGVRVRFVPFDPESGMLDLDELPGLINGRTKLLAIGAASNALGTVSDVKAACAVAREAGVRTFVDAVHYAAHNLVDVRDVGCDFLACSAYKFYGPHIGILYGRGELLRSIDFPKLRPAPENSPDRVETGTQSHESIAGAAAAVDFLASLAGGKTRRERLENGFRELHARQAALVRRLWDGLSSVPNLRIYGPGPDMPRTSTVSFVIAGVSSESVAATLAEKGLFASNGDFYASTVVEKLGLAEVGLLRIGCGIYTTEVEIDRLIRAVSEI
jgi:cysteine desulfurase family protein (TIGR01976 family)